MGGFGSGRWYRWDKQTSMEETRRLDIRFMNQQGMLKQGQRGTISWTVGGRPSGSIGWKMEGDGLVLNYVADGEEIEEYIYLGKTPCHFGGERHWFHCPDCHSRVAVLSLYSSRFICRHCHELPYGCQSEGYTDRMIRKARKIRNKLGADMSLFESIWDKPKGMHWKTFERLQEREQVANDYVTQAMAARLGIFNPK